MVFVEVNDEVHEVLKRGLEAGDVVPEADRARIRTCLDAPSGDKPRLIHHRVLATAAKATDKSLVSVLSTATMKVVDWEPVVPVRSKELDERLEKLRLALEAKQYQAMVKDVAGSRYDDRAGEMDMRDFRNQLSVGLNVIVTMLTCFALGFFTFRTYFSSSQLGLYGGLLGLIVGLGVEGTLVITRVYTIDQNQQKREQMAGKNLLKISSTQKPAVEDRPPKRGTVEAAEIAATTPGGTAAS